MNSRKPTNFYLYESRNALPKKTDFSQKSGFKKFKKFLKIFIKTQNFICVLLVNKG